MNANSTFGDVEELELRKGSEYSEENTDDDELMFYRTIVLYAKFFIEGVGILAIGIVGLLINVLALYILFRKQVMRNFHLLMCCLAVYDFFHLIMDILCFALPEFSQAYRNHFLLHMIPIFIPITQITLTGSCYTTIAITIERFLSIRHPFFIQRHNIKARAFLTPVFAFAILYNVPRFFEFQVQSVCPKYNASLHLDEAENRTCENKSTILAVTEMRRNPAYISIYVNTMNLLFNILVPFLTMGVMNYMIYRAMNKSHLFRSQRGQANYTAPAARYRRSFQRARQHSITAGAAAGTSSEQSGGLNSNDQNLRRSGENVLRKREARITRASIAITVMFVVCHLPRCIPNLMEILMEQQNMPKWLPILVSINHLLIAINSAFNFLFYLSYCWGRRKNGTNACQSFCFGARSGSGRGGVRSCFSGVGSSGGMAANATNASINTATEWDLDLNQLTEINGLIASYPKTALQSTTSPSRLLSSYRRQSFKRSAAAGTTANVVVSYKSGSTHVQFSRGNGSSSENI